MSESRALLLESAERLFADLQGDSRAAWRSVTDAGFDTLLVAEASGGFGGDWGDAFAVLRLAGMRALALPLGEAMAGARLAAEAGLACGAGVVTLAQRSDGVVAEGRFSGHLEAVPWARDARLVLFDTESGLACVSIADARVEPRLNPVGEPRDLLVFDRAPAQSSASRMSVRAAGALVRVAQISGALDAALAMSIQYANERVQFGKAIGKFQAVQQALAVFAEEAAAVSCAGQAAARAADRGDAAFEIAAAKLRANMAAAVGASIAHQVHGAIGFTQEHALHELTQRLVTWRSEFGGEQYWAQHIGAGVSVRGAEAFWPFLTARDDNSGERP